MSDGEAVATVLYHRLGQEYRGNYGGVWRTIVDGVITESELPEEVGMECNPASLIGRV